MSRGIDLGNALRMRHQAVVVGSGLLKIGSVEQGGRRFNRWGRRTGRRSCFTISPRTAPTPYRFADVRAGSVSVDLGKSVPSRGGRSYDFVTARIIPSAVLLNEAQVHREKRLPRDRRRGRMPPDSDGRWVAGHGP